MKLFLLRTRLLKIQSQCKILDLNLKEFDVINLSKPGLLLEANHNLLF